MKINYKDFVSENDYVINEENLKWAFYKLKSYYYYYKSSLYLKKKIIDFENKYKNNPNIFKNISDKINNHFLNGTYQFSDEHINFCAYPKKNSIKIGADSYIASDVNYFTDFEIEVYLVDIIFCMNLYNRFSGKISEFSYGSLFSGRLQQSKNPMENIYLIDSYQNGYKKWRNLAEEVINENLNQGSTIVVLDIKKCFYNIRFNFNKVLEHLKLSLNDSAIYMKSIYTCYTSNYFKEILKIQKNANESILPVGLISSGIILNVLFKQFDEKIGHSNGIEKYGRYVDDIFISFSNTNGGETLKELFSTHLGELFNFENDEIYIKNDFLAKSKILINGDKATKRFVSASIKYEKENIDYKSFFKSTSFIDYDEDDFSSDPASNSPEDRSLNQIRNLIFTLKNSNKKDDLFIYNFSDSELLNMYCLWFDMFKLLNENKSVLKNRLEKCISSLKIKDNTCSSYLTATFRNELNDAYTFSNCSVSDLKYMLNVDASTKLKIIDEKIKGTFNKIVPFTITLADISYYLSCIRLHDQKSNLLKETNEKYLEINSFSFSGFLDSLDFVEEKYDVDDILVRRNFSSNIDDKKYKSVKAAVACLNMENLISDEINWVLPTDYDLNTILEVINGAAKAGAEYILFPEFAFDKSWILPICYFCRSKRITLIGGIRHFKYSDGSIGNLTLIYESNSGLVRLKEKHYLPPLEKQIINYDLKSTYYEPAIKKTIFINDGRLFYSICTCYEITNLSYRAKFLDNINALFVPVFNKDTSYFNNIISSFSRDASCFVLQSNSNHLGDSRITRPTESEQMDLVKLKGGINAYFVIGEINIMNLNKNHEKFLDGLKDIDKHKKVITKDYISKKEPKIKPLSAQNHKPI